MHFSAIRLVFSFRGQLSFFKRALLPFSKSLEEALHIKTAFSVILCLVFRMCRGDTCTQKHKLTQTQTSERIERMIVRRMKRQMPVILQQLTCGSLWVKLMGKWVWQRKHRPNTSVHMWTQREELLDHLLYVHNIAQQITNISTLTVHRNTIEPPHWPDMKSFEFIRIFSLSCRRGSKKLALFFASQATSCPTSWHEANFATCLHHTYHFALLSQPLHTALVLVFVFVHSGSEVVNKQGLHTELS